LATFNSASLFQPVSFGPGTLDTMGGVAWASTAGLLESSEANRLATIGVEEGKTLGEHLFAVRSTDIVAVKEARVNNSSQEAKGLSP